MLQYQSVPYLKVCLPLTDYEKWLSSGDSINELDLQDGNIECYEMIRDNTNIGNCISRSFNTPTTPPLHFIPTNVHEDPLSFFLSPVESPSFSSPLFETSSHLMDSGLLFPLLRTWMYFGESWARKTQFFSYHCRSHVCHLTVVTGLNFKIRSSLGCGAHCNCN